MMAKKNTRPLLSLVIPAYQEEQVIGATLEKVAEYLKKYKLHIQTEIIVVSADGSDRTHELVLAKESLFKNFLLIRPGAKVGKGRDVRDGVLAAQGKYIIFTDADLATPLHHIIPALKLLEEGADIVIGVRDLENIHTGFRKIVSLAANKISRMLVAPGRKDTQCGFKAFNERTARDLFSSMKIMGWAFDMELIYIARKRNHVLKELPIPDWSERKPPELQLAGENGTRAAVHTLVEVLKIRWNGLLGSYTRKK